MPPAPAWISIKQWFGSIGLENIRRNSSVPGFFRPQQIIRTARMVSSLSLFCPSRTARGCRPGRSGCRSPATTSSSAFFSDPDPGRAWRHSRYPGSSVRRETSSRRSFLPGSQRYLPDLVVAGGEISQFGVDLVEDFSLIMGCPVAAQDKLPTSIPAQPVGWNQSPYLFVGQGKNRPFCVGAGR